MQNLLYKVLLLCGLSNTQFKWRYFNYVFSVAYKSNNAFDNICYNIFKIIKSLIIFFKAAQMLN
jgi:hypothetical protein